MKRFLNCAAIAIAAILISPAVAGAGKIEPDVDPSIADGSAARHFNEARSKWLSSGVTRYRFSISATCFCPYTGDIKVTVRGKKKTVSSRDWFGPRSVPALFKVIHGAITREAANLAVKYDGKTGHPRAIAIDYDRMIADEEIGYTVKKFRQLP